LVFDTALTVQVAGDWPVGVSVNWRLAQDCHRAGAAVKNAAARVASGNSTNA
jgi:hypothetical protein